MIVLVELLQDITQNKMKESMIMRSTAWKTLLILVKGTLPKKMLIYKCPNLHLKAYLLRLQTINSLKLTIFKGDSVLKTHKD